MTGKSMVTSFVISIMITVSEMVNLETPAKNEAAPISAIAPGSIQEWYAFLSPYLSPRVKIGFIFGQKTLATHRNSNILQTIVQDFLQSFFHTMPQ